MFNKRNSIGRTIESVLDQGYQDWELLIIDDGSVDGSGDVVSDYLGDKRIKYQFKQNSGVSATRNMGIQQALGEWIIYIDADDYFLPNAFETLLYMAEKYGLDVVAGNYYVESDGLRVPALRYVKERVVANNFRSLYLGSFDIRAGATMFRSTLIKQYYFDESLTRYEDAKVEFDILRNNKVAISPQFLMVYTQDYSCLSHPCTNFSRDFISCMSFESKPFWEKIFLGRLIKEGLKTYPSLRSEIRSKYQNNLKWMYLSNCIMYSYRCVVSFLKCIYVK